MPVNLRRLSRPVAPRAYPSAEASVVLGLTRQVRRLVAAEASRTRLSDAQLDALAVTSSPDADAASRFWDAAQRRARTGLDGLLSP